MELWSTILISFATGVLSILGTIFTLKAKKKQAFAEADGAELDNDKKRIENEGLTHDLYLRIYDDLNKRFNEMFKEKDEIISKLKEEVKDIKEQMQRMEEERKQYLEESAKKDAIISAAMSCKNLKNCPVMARREQIFNIAVEEPTNDTF